jgi:hypothetical protein
LCCAQALYERLELQNDVGEAVRGKLEALFKELSLQVRGTQGRDAARE